MSPAAVLDDYLDGLLGDALAPSQSPSATAGTEVPVAASPLAPAAVLDFPLNTASIPADSADTTAPAPVVTEPAPLAPRPVAPAQPKPPAPNLTPAARAKPLLPTHMLGPSAASDDVDLRPNRRSGDRATRWLRLRCGAQAYGLELLKVQEVVLASPLLRLRGTPPAMLGVMNLRGQVVPVMDLGLHLGQAAQPVDAATRIVVLEEHGETLGLRVSLVEDVANLTELQIEPPDNARVGRIRNDLFRGIARLSGDPMILLDASCLLVPPSNRDDAA